MSFVVRKDVRIYYEERGSGGLEFVLVHGSRCDHTSMEPLARHLSARGRVVSLDLRGHGLSDKPPGPYSGEDFLEEVTTVVAAVNMSNPVLIGHSMGARVVAGVASVYPDCARALVLLDNSVNQSPSFVAARMAELRDEPTANSLRRARVERMFLPTDHSPEREAILDGILGTPLATQVAIQTAADEIDPAAALRGCRVPVLYISGSAAKEDPATLLSLKSDLVYGRVVGSGHFVQIDAPAQVNAMIDRFIQEYVE